MLYSLCDDFCFVKRRIILMLLLLRMYIKMYEYDNSKSAATYVLLLSPDYLRRCVISIISYTIRKRSKKINFEILILCFKELEKNMMKKE